VSGIPYSDIDRETNKERNGCQEYHRAMQMERQTKREMGVRNTMEDIDRETNIERNGCQEYHRAIQMERQTMRESGVRNTIERYR